MNDKYPGAIEHALVVGARRIWRFLRWSFAAWAVLWGWVMALDYGIGWGDMLSTTWTVISNPTSRIARTLLYGAGVISCETVLIFFLVIGLWWKSRGDVYRRGALPIDRREGR